ncbi:MAG: hypothetical protein UY50_C0024G0007 [Parcubacteria group bacterium GW2011_GWA2_49_9]|nr:MAG: hypothetical protein UY50_C0024G0007 [Parcubacteria group bacterium GW2011_GWA2_49_9]
MQKKTAQGSSTAVKLGIIGASIAGLAASYYFLGPDGKAHRTHAKAWAIKMKGDVVERLEKAKDVSESVYHEIVDSVAAEYTRGKKAGEREISALAEDLKKHWKSLSHSVKSAKRDVSASAGRVAKKAGL